MDLETYLVMNSLEHLDFCIVFDTAARMQIVWKL